MSEPGSGRFRAVSRSDAVHHVVETFAVQILAKAIRRAILLKIEIVLVLLRVLGLARRRDNENRLRVGEHGIGPGVENVDALFQKTIEADIVARRPLEITGRRQLEDAIVVLKHADVRRLPEVPDPRIARSERIPSGAT